MGSSYIISSLPLPPVTESLRRVFESVSSHLQQQVLCEDFNGKSLLDLMSRDDDIGSLPYPNSSLNTKMSPFRPNLLVMWNHSHVNYNVMQ